MVATTIEDTGSDLDKKEMYVSCQCLSEIVKIEQYNDEHEIYLSVFRYLSPSYSFWRKLVMCWDVLKGRGIRTADVIISREDFEQLKQF